VTQWLDELRQKSDGDKNQPWRPALPKPMQSNAPTHPPGPRSDFIPARAQNGGRDRLQCFVRLLPLVRQSTLERRYTRAGRLRSAASSSLAAARSYSCSVNSM
jgi:hypothetical protein